MSLRSAALLPLAYLLSGSILIAFQDAAALDVPIRVRETAGVEHHETVVTTGIPIPKGRLFSDQAVEIDGSPGQFRTLATWGDGSVKWLLASFAVKVGANASQTYHLRNGTGDASGGVSVVRTEGVVSVDTGPLRFTLVEDGFNLFDEVWLAREEGAPLRLVSPRATNGSVVEDPSGNVYTSSNASPVTLTIEESGPLRAVVHFRGKHRGSAGEHLEFSGRIYAFRGSREVHVQFSQTNMVPTALNNWQPACRRLGAPNSLYFEDLSLVTRIDLAGAPRYAIQGASEGPVVRGALNGNASLYQDSSGAERWHASRGVSFRGYEIREGGSRLETGHQAEGFADLNDGTRGVTVAIRHFWENFPNKLSVSEDGAVTIGVMPRDFAERFEHRSGERKTHWTLFYFHEGDEVAARSAERARTFHHPLRVAAPAEWYVDSGAFDDLAQYDAVRFPDYEAHNRIAASGFLEKRIESDYFGWMDFGDLWADQEGGDVPNTNKASANLEYDAGFAFILQALRTADIDDELSDLWWKLAEQGNQHTADVDVYHVTEGPLPWMWGGMWNHTYGDGFEDPHRGNSPNTAHSWNRGMLNWYFLTGNRTVLEAATKVAENVRWRVLNGPGGPGYSETDGEERAPGHALQVVTDAYLFTWEESYLDAARKIVHESRPEVHPQYSSPDTGDWSTKPWMVSILVKSLGRFASVMQRERGVREEEAISSLLDRAAFLEYRAWNDRDGSTASYMPYRVHGDGRDDDPFVTMWSVRASDAFTWAHRHETDPERRARYRQIAQHAFEDGSRHPWCQNCPNFEYMTAKVHQVVAGSGMEWMREVAKGGVRSGHSPDGHRVILGAGRPNPFSRAQGTRISFRLPEAFGPVAVRLDVVDVGGRRLRTLFDGPVPGDALQTVRWDGTDDSGAVVAPGVYFYRLATAPGIVEARRTVFLK